MKPLWDVAIAGAGPAGAVAALELARSGHAVLLLDDRDFAARKVGESLPAAAGRLLAKLQLRGLIDGNDAHRRSHGNASSWGSEGLRRTDFLRDPDGSGWHLDRAEFERQLLHRAIHAGVTHRPIRVRSVCRAESAWKLRLSGGPPTRARWLIDATGRRAVVARALGVRRRRDDALVALYAWAGRAKASEHVTLIESTPAGWWYTAPLPEAARVVVFHTDGEQAAAIRNTPGAWIDALAGTRHVGSLLDGASWEAPPRGTEAGGARLERFAGDGWLAVGDAALSFDPLSSQGLLTSLYTGMRGAGAVRAGLRGDTGAIRVYAARLEDIRSAYLRAHRRAYAEEWRWPERPFWKRRSGP